MFSSDEEEEEHSNEFFFWNNWEPSVASVKKVNLDFVPIENKYTTMKCWLPPVNFRLIRDRRQLTNRAIDTDCDFIDSSFVKKQEGFDWGSRVPYPKCLTAIEDNDVIWNLFHVNIFGVFKLWKNELGNIFAFAEAEFENGTADEKAILVVNKQCLLRKLLNVSTEEWSALLEALADTKLILTFDALQSKNEHTLASLDKLWHFLCKRRHYLPCVSIRMRRLGVKKLTQYLKILPKFVAEEIRTYNDADIV